MTIRSSINNIKEKFINSNRKKENIGLALGPLLFIVIVFMIPTPQSILSVASYHRMCTDCFQASDGQFSQCGEPYDVHTVNPPSGSIVAPQPPTNVAPPKTCPDGSAPDANGNCTPVTQAPTDQGTIQSSPTKHHKGSDLGQLGGSRLNSDNNSPRPITNPDNNNDKPSKHHKAGAAG